MSDHNLPIQTNDRVPPGARFVIDVAAAAGRFEPRDLVMLEPVRRAFPDVAMVPRGGDFSVTGTNQGERALRFVAVIRGHVRPF